MEFLPIHIGMHKTATTFLQSLVFPQMFPHAPRTKAGWIENSGVEYQDIMLSMADDLEKTDPKSAFDIRKRFDSSSKEKSIILSAESWSGRQRSSFENESWDRFTFFLNAISKIERPARLVMFVRPHDTWLRSGYLYQYRLGARESFGKFLEGFSDYDLSWSMRAKALQDFKCRIYSYEDFRKNPLGVINDICDFWDVERLPDLPVSRINSAPKKLAVLNAMRVCHQGASVIKRITKSNYAENILRQFSETKLRKMDAFFTSSLFSDVKEMKGLNIPDDYRDKFTSDWAALEPFLCNLDDKCCVSENARAQ